MRTPLASSGFTLRGPPIELLAVAPALHRQGVGRQLVDVVEADLRNQGIELLR